ncbi:hypothetical protein [Paraburkholderia sp. J63]|uniref:hypothetical protein n=1 Tax=Paraburkholderia sp. J63 TaxID=2805434 RepID=UPI002ABD6CAD|nr:hypothetical protein [Paraburkholderia sp. J63]
MADVNGDEDENAGERPGDNQKDSEAPEHDGEGAAKSATPTSIKDVAWEIFKPVAALGFIVSLVGAIALYVYLQRIGWPELLQPSLASKTGVALVVGSSIVVLASLVITMYGSAYWTNFVAHSYGQPASIPRRFGWFVLVLHLGWLVILAGVMLGSGDAKPVPEVARKQIHSLSENFQSGIVVFFGAAAAASVLLHWWGRRNLFDSLAGALTGGRDGRFRLLWARLKSIGRKPDSPQQGGSDSWVCRAFARVCRVFTWARAGRVLADTGRGLQLAVGCLFSSLAACVFVEINPDIGASDVTIPLVLMLCAVTLPGMVVGIRYAACYRATGNAKTSVKEVAWLVLLMVWRPARCFPPRRCCRSIRFRSARFPFSVERPTSMCSKSPSAGRCMKWWGSHLLRQTLQQPGICLPAKRKPVRQETDGTSIIPPSRRNLRRSSMRTSDITWGTSCSCAPGPMMARGPRPEVRRLLYPRDLRTLGLQLPRFHRPLPFHRYPALRHIRRFRHRRRTRRVPHRTVLASPCAKAAFRSRKARFAAWKWIDSSRQDCRGPYGAMRSPSDNVCHAPVNDVAQATSPLHPPPSRDPFPRPCGGPARRRAP